MNAAPRRPPTIPRGLAVERTSLAWTRSALAIVAIAASLAKAGEQSDQLLIAGLAVAVLVVLAVAVWWAGQHVQARRTGELPADLRASRRLMLLLPVAAVVSAVAAFTIALLT